MASRAPPEFKDLATVVAGGEAYGVNVMGVVHDFMAPAPSKGSDFQMLLRLRDKSMLTTGMRIKFFSSMENLPAVHQLGDVVLLRNIRVRTLFT